MKTLTIGKKLTTAVLALLLACCLFVGFKSADIASAAEDSTGDPSSTATITFTETKLNISKNGKKMLIVTAINDVEYLKNVSALGYTIDDYTKAEGDFADTDKYYSSITLGETTQTAVDIFGSDANDKSKLLIWEIGVTAGTTYKIKAYATIGNNEGTVDGTEKEYTYKDDSELTTAPAPKTLTYTGEAQALVSAGSAVGGTVWYKLGEDGTYSKTIPTAIYVATYTVYYKVVGDSTHNDVAEAHVEVTIAKAKNAIGDFTIDPTTCKKFPDLKATATAGTVTYKYATSRDGKYENIPTGGLTAGTYYVKAYTEGDSNYASAESNPATLTVNHSYEWKTDSDCNDYRECVCGDKVKFVITPTADVLEKTESGYALKLYSAADGDKKNSVTISFTVAFGETKTPKAAVTWKQSNEGIVEITGEKEYTIKATNIGTTVLTATYTTEGKKASFAFTVTTERLVVTLDVHPKIEVENLSPLTINALSGKASSVLLGEENIMASADGKTITLDKTKLPKTAADMGDNMELTIVTDNADYKLTADIYTLIISDKAEFDQMRNLARNNGNYDSTGILDGYFVLDSDIAYNGEFESLTDSKTLWTINNTLKGDQWYNSALYGFKGVFDGRGYNVDGLTVKDLGNESGGIIGLMNNEGVFKNVSFTNATVYENSGYICSVGGGLIENVQISFIQIGKGGTTRDIDSWTPRAMGAFYTYQPKETNATVKNCVVDAINAEIYYTVGANNQPNLKLGTKAKWENVTNLIVLCDGENADAIINGTVKSASAKSYSEFKTDEKCQAAAKALDSDLWTINSNLPFMRSLADKVVGVNVDFVNLATTVNNGDSIKITANSKYSEITIEGLYEGVTFENGVLSVAESAIGGTVKVTVRSLLNESFKEAEITIKRTKNVSPEQKDTILLEETDKGIDLSFASVYLGESVSLTYKGAVLGEGAIADGKLTVNLSGITDRGELTFLASALKDNVTYTFNVNVLLATKIIRNADDLNAIRVTQENINNKTSIFGYYVLANDISLGWGTLPETSLNYTEAIPFYKADFGFRGTFDGRGHTISRFAVTTNGIFGHVGRGAVIKNVNFDRLTYNKAYYATLFGFTVREAEITDVNISLAGYNMLDSDKHCQGFLAARCMQDNKLTNVEIDASNFEVYTIFGQTVSNNTCNGVEIKVKSYTTLGFINDTVSDATMIHEMDGVEVKTSSTSTES